MCVGNDDYRAAGNELGISSSIPVSRHGGSARVCLHIPCSRSAHHRVWYFCTQTRHSTSSVFKIDLFRQVLFFAIILCFGWADRYRYELEYNGPDSWSMIRRVAISPIAAPASDRAPPSNLWDAASSGLQSEWLALLRIPCAPGVILIRGKGVEIPVCLTCCGRKTKD